MQAASHRYSRDDSAIFTTCEKPIKEREGSIYDDQCSIFGQKSHLYEIAKKRFDSNRAWHQVELSMEHLKRQPSEQHRLEIPIPFYFMIFHDSLTR